MTTKETSCLVLARLGWEDLSRLELDVMIIMTAADLDDDRLERPLPIELAHRLNMPPTPASTFAIRQALEALATRGLLDRVEPATRRSSHAAASARLTLPASLENCRAALERASEAQGGSLFFTA